MLIAAGLALIATFTIAASVLMTKASNLPAVWSIFLACVLALLFAVGLAGIVVVSMRLING